MPYDDPTWDIPLGYVGIACMAVVGAVAFTLGQFNFYGIQFLAYGYLIGGWSAKLSVFAAAWGTLLECMIWKRGVGLRSIISRPPLGLAVLGRRREP